MTDRSNHDQPAEGATTLGIPAAVFWPGFSVLLLVVSLSVGAVAFYLASNDPSFAIEDDYYQRALRWDASSADQRSSDALGWTLAVEVGSVARASGERSIRVLLFDAQGQPITDAQVTIEVFAHARAADRSTPALEAMDDGSYAGLFRPSMSGLWEFRVQATRGEEHFMRAQEQFLNLERGK